MLNLVLLAVGFLLIVLGVILAAALGLGAVGIALEIVGVLLLGVNIGLMIHARRGNSPR
ncbi:hypothetical protein [Microbacterium gorillae]|uniref:hypothetical protein n=1 Tax=Microbacterium gorillae TaxID=1231063 RepID=UPI000ADEA1DF|nr:hypothetical protein [Microbacterium gorillae]